MVCIIKMDCNHVIYKDKFCEKGMVLGSIFADYNGSITRIIAQEIIPSIVNARARTFSIMPKSEFNSDKYIVFESRSEDSNLDKLFELFNKVEHPVSVHSERRIIDKE